MSEVPSINPKLDAMGEMLKTIHDLQERNKMLEAQIEKMKCCENCAFQLVIGGVRDSHCVKCNAYSEWELAD